MDTYKVYCYTNIINGKKYIGQTYRTLEQRAGKNGNEYCRKKSKFASAIKHYGWENFKAEILKDNLSLEEANFWEQYYIEYYHTWILDPQCNGYNMQKGGNNHRCILGPKSEETKKKMSIAKQGIKRSEETKKKIGEKNKTKIQKKKNNREKKIICVETNIIYNSIKEASKKNNICYQSICDNLHDRRKSAGGYHWHFYN